MKSNLSTDELFHFTKIDRLINIIKEGFLPFYNLEHTFCSNLFNRPAVLAGIPMVSFCDIPLNMVYDHSSKYGKCAIGLDKKWGEKYGLNPVIYIHKNSRLGDAISSISNSFSKYKSSMISEGSDMRIFTMISTFAKGLSQLSYYVKQYERPEDEECYIGDTLLSFKKGRFYDEREWRYVPPFPLIDIKIFDNKDELHKANEKLKQHSLNFGIDDIKFLISETEKEKEILIAAVSNRYNVDTKTVMDKIIFKRLDET
jgi:hypothetical protein